MNANVPNRQISVNPKFAYLAMDIHTDIDKICHMDKLAPNRIKELREIRELTIEELAEKTGMSTSYLSRLQNGERNLSQKNMNLIAHALDVSPAELLPSTTQKRGSVAMVMGKIGAGAEITPDEEQVPPEGLFEIETPFPLPDDAIAFEVTGESMWPRYDPGDVIICYRQGVAPQEVIGWEAAVKTEDGKRYLKRIVKGATNGTYDLESHNHPPIRNVKLEWVAAVQSVIRIGQWRKLPPSAVNHEYRRMTNSA